MSEAMSKPLLATKLHIPSERTTLVARPSLLARLDAQIGTPLILVAAGAGFGKTTLIAAWASHHQGQVAWLALDAADNEPTRFFAYFIAAIQTCRPSFGAALLSALQSFQPPSSENIVTVLLNQLADCALPLLIVLDDYHLISETKLHAALFQLITHLPEGVTLVMITRSDPPFPMARLRAAQTLFELRSADLRFSPTETDALLNQIGHLNLAPPLIESLDKCTEGWIAGLQLAALAMNNDAIDKTSFVQHFSGSQRYILDYLIEEVFSQQPAAVKRFLLQTADLYELSSALCDAVSGESNGDAMLGYLERNNLFVIALDSTRTWYRYHQLFADLLQSRQTDSPAERQQRLQRVADWYESQNRLEDAIRYALRAASFEQAARLISIFAIENVYRGEVNTLLGWFRAFPTGVIEHYPDLCLYFGQAFALNGHWTEAESLLVLLEQVQPATTAIKTLPLAYLVSSYKGDNVRLATLGSQLRATAQAQQVNPWSGDSLSMLSLALLLASSGDLPGACQVLMTAYEQAVQRDQSAVSLQMLCQLCRLLVLAGDLTEAYRWCQRGLAIVPATTPIASFIYSALGRIFIEWHQLDEAGRYLHLAVQLAEQSGFLTGLLSSSTMMLAEVYNARGDGQATAEMLQQAIGYAEQFDPPSEVDLLKVYGARLWLAQGNIAKADAWLANRPQATASLFYPTVIQAVVQAQWYLSKRQTEKAITLLTNMISQPRSLLTVDALALLALIRSRRGDSINATTTLAQALAMAEPNNRQQAFIGLGPDMAKLIADYAANHPDQTFAQKVSAACLVVAQRSANNPRLESFSQRELDVLRLLVAGQSNDEIARSLTLAVSTIKWYVNALYEKLNVKTRSQAIARVHQLKLFGD